jgi:hypothetical protein
MLNNILMYLYITPHNYILLTIQNTLNLSKNIKKPILFLYTNLH